MNNDDSIKLDQDATPLKPPRNDFSPSGRYYTSQADQALDVLVKHGRTAKIRGDAATEIRRRQIAAQIAAGELPDIEAKAAALEEKLKDLLWEYLRHDAKSKDCRRTGWGPKTMTGLALSIKTIVDDVYTPTRKVKP